MVTNFKNDFCLTRKPISIQYVVSVLFYFLFDIPSRLSFHHFGYFIDIKYIDRMFQFMWLSSSVMLCSSLLLSLSKRHFFFTDQMGCFFFVAKVLLVRNKWNVCLGLASLKMFRSKLLFFLLLLFKITRTPLTIGQWSICICQWEKKNNNMHKQSKRNKNEQRIYVQYILRSSKLLNRQSFFFLSRKTDAHLTIYWKKKQVIQHYSLSAKSSAHFSFYRRTLCV